MKPAALAACLALAAAMAVVAPAGAGKVDAGQPDAERLALGRALVEASRPELASGRWPVEAVESSISMGVALAWWTSAFNDKGSAQPDPFAGVDARQLHASLMAGAAAVAPGLPDALGRVYATELDAPTLKALIAFYASPGEQAAQARRRSIVEQLHAQSPDPFHPLQGRATASVDVKRVAIESRKAALREKVVSEATPEEKSFAGTPAGQKVAAKSAELQAGTEAVIQSVWPRLIAAARADYCRHETCNAKARKLFDGFAKVDFARMYARPAESFAGQTADQIFAKPADIALAKAACGGDAAAVQAALRAGGDANAVGRAIDASDGDPWTFTPLIWAVNCRSDAGIDALLAAGARPNLAGPNGETAVSIAARIDDPEALRLLLRHGGDANARTGFGVPLQLANSSADTLQALLDGGADCARASVGSVTLVATLIEPAHWQELAVLLRAGCPATPDDLAYAAWTAQEDDADDPYRDEVIAALKARGVTFPTQRPPEVVPSH